MEFLTLGWHSHNSIAKFVKTMLWIVLYNLFGFLPLGIYMAINDIDDIQYLVQGNMSGVGIILLSVGFGAALVGLWWQMQKYYERDKITLITPQMSVQWRKFFVSAAIWGGMMIIASGIEIMLNPDDYIFTFDPLPFVSLLLGALIAIPIQASTEEIIFRGYIMQQCSYWGKFVWVPVLFSSVLFALAHYSNPEVGAYGIPIMMSGYALTGVIWGIAAIMDNGLEIAMGAHTANNIIAFLMMTEKNAVLRTPALFTDISPSISWYSVLTLLVAGCVFLLILSKLYAWGDWSVLWSRIIPPPIPSEQPSIADEHGSLG